VLRIEATVTSAIRRAVAKVHLAAISRVPQHRETAIAAEVALAAAVVASAEAQAAAPVEVVSAAAEEEAAVAVVVAAAGAAGVEEDADDDHLKESIPDVSTSTVVYSVACANRQNDRGRCGCGVRDAACGLCSRAAVLQVA
jgi:hypothetical protein